MGGENEIREFFSHENQPLAFVCLDLLRDITGFGWLLDSDPLDFLGYSINRFI